MLRCPKEESLFEYLSIPGEMNRVRRLSLFVHLRSCPDCSNKLDQIKSLWNSYLTPAPDITSSLIRVYSRLQKDETLILKGWKLGTTQAPKSFGSFLFEGGWLFRGSVGAAFASLIFVIVIGQFSKETPTPSNTPIQAAFTRPVEPPFAEIRFEEKNHVQVHYVKPQLIQSMDFETTSLR